MKVTNGKCYNALPAFYINIDNTPIMEFIHYFREIYIDMYLPENTEIILSFIDKSTFASIKKLYKLTKLGKPRI